MTTASKDQSQDKGPQEGRALLLQEYQHLCKEREVKRALRALVKDSMEQHVLGDNTVVDYYEMLGRAEDSLAAQLKALAVILGQETPN